MSNLLQCSRPLIRTLWVAGQAPHYKRPNLAVDMFFQFLVFGDLKKPIHECAKPAIISILSSMKLEPGFRLWNLGFKGLPLTGSNSIFTG